MVENNKLIAEFITDEPEVLKRDLQKEGTLESMHYHDSWDWLKPVVDKISDLWNNEGIYGGGLIWNLTIFASLEDTYKAVIEYIKWYNKNYKEI